MKVVVLGAGGIVGQHMMHTDPYDATFCRRRASGPWAGVDLADWYTAEGWLDEHEPDVVVNLAGENRVDVVEHDPEAWAFLNTTVPGLLAAWCDTHDAHLIHGSTQGIFDGEAPPYGPESKGTPITAYGRQKLAAEGLVRGYRNWTIARLTFVLGIRPFRGVGRQNPLELMFSEPEQCQVNDRWFSPCFAQDAARALWELVAERPQAATVHIGEPTKVSRYYLATLIPHAVFLDPVTKPRIHPVSHNYFKGIAPRPKDTTWAYGARYRLHLEEGLMACHSDWRRRSMMQALQRSEELGLFFRSSQGEALLQLQDGFAVAHQAVADDFRSAAPSNDDELLAWYRTTASYIWELSVYHLDAGFNYMGMCSGIVQHLLARGFANLRDSQPRRVLCMGDGIGDLTIALAQAGLTPVYHDLAESKTAQFAQFRFGLNLTEAPEVYLSPGWDPPALEPESYDAILALDFFEHLTKVEEWAIATVAALRPGGLLMAQNAFAVGDDEHGGSIPMHLTRNNRFETDWHPLMESLGMQRDGDWWIKA